MKIQLNFESKEPIFEQLMNQIIVGIAKGELLPGERLPSVRSVAADIGVNLHTVNKSYQQLQQAGFILIHRQRGVVINPAGTPKADEIYIEELKQTLHPHIAKSICRGLDEKGFSELVQQLYKDLQRKEGDQ